MIAVRIEGRLGNQLFQYAFIYSAAKNLKTNFYIDQYTDKLLLDKYFLLRPHSFDRAILNITNIQGYKNLFSFHFNRCLFKNAARLFKLNSVYFSWKNDNPHNYLSELKDRSLYLGYFQSQLYFKNHEDNIKFLFNIKPVYKKEFHYKYAYLYKNYTIICIHIRRRDFLNLGQLDLGGDNLSLPVDYYKNAIKKIVVKNPLYVFISDDNDFVTKHFDFLKNKYISTDSEIMDFQHLLNADVCIISNSTFSWWGAWLNNKSEKIIYAPQYFMGWRIKKEIPYTIYPDSWIQIDFN